MDEGQQIQRKGNWNYPRSRDCRDTTAPIPYPWLLRDIIKRCQERLKKEVEKLERKRRKKRKKGFATLELEDNNGNPEQED